MKKMIRRLPEAELDLMLVLWDAGTPVYRNYFDAALRQEKNWADSTILSLLSRLAEKGFIAVEKDGNRNRYRALVTKEEYLAVENRSFLARLHGSSLRHLVASMADEGELTRADLDDLEKLIETLKKEE